MSSELKPGYYWARWRGDFPDRWEIIKITTEREVLTTDTHVPSKGDETEYWDIGQRLKPPD